ncbi:MAG TPA: hypothetical protein VF066_00390 [Thermoleophilaceae bacterium]
MRGITRVAAAALVSLAFAPSAAAEPGFGPRETIDQTFTTTSPGTPTGLGWSGTYHATDDPNAPPPPMDKMVFYPPPGFRYDTRVPVRCAATDVELELRGPAACPPKSLIGSGTVEGLFYMPFYHQQEFERFTHHVDILNNTNEQVMLVQSEGWTVVRGKMYPDGSIEFAGPKCFPAPPAGGCADEYLVQLGSQATTPVYTTARGSYATTPPTCPDTGYWETTVRFWWADGATDSVVTKQPCSVS